MWRIPFFLNVRGILNSLDFRFRLSSGYACSHEACVCVFVHMIKWNIVGDTLKDISSSWTKQQLALELFVAFSVLWDFWGITGNNLLFPVRYVAVAFFNMFSMNVMWLCWSVITPLRFKLNCPLLLNFAAAFMVLRGWSLLISVTLWPSL